MNQLDKLQEKLGRAEDLLSERKTRRDAVVYPVLETMGYNIKRIRIENVIPHRDTTCIVYSYHFRGCDDGDSVYIPNSIFDAEDSIQAAKEYQATLEKQQSERRRQEKLEQIKRLQEELAK